MNRKRGRNDSTKFAGAPSPLKTTEVPTFRDVIKYGYHMEKLHPTLSEYTLSKLMAKEILDIWKAANPRLRLLTDNWIVGKVQHTCFRKVKQINRKSLSKVAKKILVQKLDELFNISSCSCDLRFASCDDENIQCRKENCQIKHVVCICPTENKVSLEEQEYIKDQTNKTEIKGNSQLGPVKKAAGAKSKTSIVSEEKQVDLSPLVASTSDDDQNILQSENSDEADESLEPEEDCKIKVPCYVIELLRDDVSSDVGASLANAFLMDLHALGLLKPNIDLRNIFLDKSIIDREIERIEKNIFS